jgi:hypothetical protein
MHEVKFESAPGVQRKRHLSWSHRLSSLRCIQIVDAVAAIDSGIKAGCRPHLTMNATPPP